MTFFGLQKIMERFQDKLFDLLENHDTLSGRIFDYFIQTMILISVIGYALETLPDLTPSQIEIFESIESVLVTIFTIEYLARLYAYKTKFKFIFSFYGLVDLISLVPFYFSFGIDFRFLRAVRAIKLLRPYKRATSILRSAFLSIKSELFVFFFVAILLVFFASVGIYQFEYSAQPDKFSSVIHSFWWALVTLTTVGYGDVYPITAGGKLFASIVMFIGIGIVAVPSGLIASALTKLVHKGSD